MKPMDDVARMDLRDALDFAVLVEEDAQLRYEELSRLLGDDPGGAGAVFRAMEVNEAKHARVIAERRAALFRDAPPRLEVSALEGPERPELGDGDLPATAREALEIALAAERRAHAFYAAAVRASFAPEVRAFFEDMLRDEAEHAALLEAKLAALEAPAASPAPVPQRRTEATPAPPSYPDRALLASILPRFDAATRWVAESIVVEGLAEQVVADALGVSRRTVARKLARFLEVAREHLAVALAAAALTGCGGFGLAEPTGASRQGEVLQAQHAAAAREDVAAAPAAVKPAREAAEAVSETDREAEEAVSQPDRERTRQPEPAAVTGGEAEAADRAFAEAVRTGPVIDEVSLEEAPASGGAALVIRGQNLEGALVTIGESPARTLDATGYMVIVEVPAAKAGLVDIVVTNPDGRSAMKGGFRYTG